MSDAVRQKRATSVWRESVLLVASALVLAVIVKTFLLQAFYIPSGSMEPTMLVNDRILVQKASSWLGKDVKRGDVVVFEDPGNWLTAKESRQPRNAVQRGLEVFGLFPAGGHLIKRVIGVGGDKVKCCDAAGRLMVNGVALTEPYVLDPAATGNRAFEVTVPKGYLWVMGDNRGHSEDSRAHMDEPGKGFVSVGNVVGTAWLRMWPWHRIGFITAPDTFTDLNAKN